MMTLKSLQKKIKKKLKKQKPINSEKIKEEINSCYAYAGINKKASEVFADLPRRTWVEDKPESFAQEKMEWLEKLVENQRQFFPPATEHHKNYQGFHLALDMLLTVAKQSLKEEK